MTFAIFFNLYIILISVILNCATLLYCLKIMESRVMFKTALIAQLLCYTELKEHYDLNLRQYTMIVEQNSFLTFHLFILEQSLDLLLILFKFVLRWGELIYIKQSGELLILFVLWWGVVEIKDSLNLRSMTDNARYKKQWLLWCIIRSNVLTVPKFRRFI